MTTLSDSEIAQICRDAGFGRPDLITAIACARVASGGVPAYEHVVWPGPVAHYRGLWGVDTIEWPRLAGRPLEDPHVAARAAYELTEEHGFDWCPTFRAGHHVHHESAAALGATMLPTWHRDPDHILVPRLHAALSKRMAESQRQFALRQRR